MADERPHRIRPLTRLDLPTGGTRPPSAPAAATTPSASASSRRCSSSASPPERVAKLSGIGCSSKTPAYFMSRAHAFNAVHGRMPSVATGALLANSTLVGLGVSGDGDTASIGIGQFIHLVRRNLPMVYIIEDNGVYGLTKGQFSATADARLDSSKSGVVNDLPPIDTCALAIQLGATFVGRSFSGDKRQLSAMLKAALAHRGTAMLDVISPCVTFNDHEGSTKSFAYMKDHDEAAAGGLVRPGLRGHRGRVRAGHDGRREAARRLAPPAPEARGGLRPANERGAVARLMEAHAQRRGADRRALRRHRGRPSTTALGSPTTPSRPCPRRRCGRRARCSTR